MKSVGRVLNAVRLAFFPIAYGLTGAFVGGTLNRVMIAELGFPASLVGFFFAIPLLVSPIRVWVGYRSDGYPILNLRREPYMIIGMLVTGLGLVGATVLSLSIAATTGTLVIGALVAFSIYGFGRNLGHNTFQALIADKFEGDQRPRAVTGYEVATLLGFIAGAGGLGAALETFDPGRMITVAIGASSVAFLLTLLAALWNEPRTEQNAAAADRSRGTPFRVAVRQVLLGDPQVRLFFILIMLTFVGTLAQDVLLEPYGALVLGMPVGATTRLTMFWGLGVMAAMILSGLFLIKWLGYMRVLRIGLISSMLVFVGVIATGMAGNPGAFQGLVLLMGLGTGMAGAGMLTGVINFTTSIRAGMLLGFWGVANQVGHAFGSLMGGGVVDIVLRLTGGNAFNAYATVFGIEAVMLVVALVLSFRFRPEVASVKREIADSVYTPVGALGD